MLASSRIQHPLRNTDTRFRPPTSWHLQGAKPWATFGTSSQHWPPHLVTRLRPVVASSRSGQLGHHRPPPKQALFSPSMAFAAFDLGRLRATFASDNRGCTRPLRRSSPTPPTSCRATFRAAGIRISISPSKTTSCARALPIAPSYSCM